MTKQKKGLWLFIFSLIPGAGELYMGFRKQGISIMLIFWSVIALGAGFGMGWILMFLPILWFYSFFNVHNLKSLSPEEFYAVEDSYILHLDQFIGDADHFITKYRPLVAVFLIVFGISILWSNFSNILYWILPDFLGNFINEISYRLPQIIIAVAIIIAGFYILSDKKHRLNEDSQETDEGEHYWEPYRPFQQSQETADSQSEEIKNDAGPSAEVSGAPEEKPAPSTEEKPAAPAEEEPAAPAKEHPPYPQKEINKDK